MLKSLFESSIDKLHIPADMKDAIKQINKICLEAEGDDKEKNLAYTKDLGYTPLSEEDKKKAEKLNADQERKENAEKDKQKEMEAKGQEPENGTQWNNKDFDYTVKFPSANQEEKAAETKTEQPAQNTDGNASEQPAQTASAQPAQNADGKTAEQPAAQPTKPQYRRGADVATVQFYLQSILPGSNVVSDGILGPKTITAIQKKEDLEETGKMNSQTQNAFNQLLAEAKKKVIPIQEKLGVTADGLIGKQTLQAMAKQNMNVANVFSKDVKNANAPAGNTNVASKKSDVNVLDTPFDAAKAEKELANNQITKLEYNIWKGYGISPDHQRQNPNETKAECSRLAHYTPSERQQIIQERLAKNNPKTDAQSNQKQPTGADKFKPQNEEEQKIYDKTLNDYINVYKKMGSDDKAAAKQAERVAQNHLYHYRKGTLPKAQTPESPKQTVGVGNDKNVAEVAANVKGPQNDAEKKFFNQTKENWTKVYAEKFKNNPERIAPAADQQARIELMKYRARMAQAARKNGQQQVAQQQVGQQNAGQQNNQQQVAANGNTTPAQTAAPKQKQQNQGTQYYSGKVSYINLPPDEKKVYDEAEKKSLDKNMKWGKNEQIALDQAALDASTAVLKYRAQKGGNQKG